MCIRPLYVGLIAVNEELFGRIDSDFGKQMPSNSINLRQAQGLKEER